MCKIAAVRVTLNRLVAVKFKLQCTIVFRNVRQKYLNKLANMFTVVHILIKMTLQTFFYTIIYNKEKFTTIYNKFLTVFLYHQDS